MESRRAIARDTARIARQVRSGDFTRAEEGLALLRQGSLALYARLLEGTVIKRSGRLVAGAVFSFAADAEEAGVGQCALLIALAEAPPEALPDGVVLSAVTKMDLSALALTRRIRRSETTGPQLQQPDQPARQPRDAARAGIP